LTAFTRFKVLRAETSDNYNSKEVKRVTCHVCCQDTDESGDLSPPRKVLARDDCDIITIGIHLISSEAYHLEASDLIS